MNVLKKIIPATLKSKLRLALFAIGFFPFVFILVYLHNLGESKILDDTLAIHHAQMHTVKKRIEEQLSALDKEISFLASLSLMDDMIVNDVDKRISNILLHKQQDITAKVDLFTVDRDAKIIASTAHEIKDTFAYPKVLLAAKQEGKRYFFHHKDLYLFTPISSNLQKESTLGYLILRYPLLNLNHFLVHQNGIRSLFYFPQNALQIGHLFDSEPLHLTPYENDYMNEKYLILQEQFEGLLSSGFIVYQIEKSVALSFLDQFMFFVWVLFALGFLVIALLSWWIGERILKPIARLSDATKSIVSTQDYSTQVSVASEEGEIRELAENFNVMVAEINTSFQKLEEENRVRLLRFVQLVNIFNGLIQTQSEEACIGLALDELQGLVPEQTFTFSSEYPEEKKGLSMMLYVKDFEQGSSHFYGVISLSDREEIRDEEERRFYRAIATMIMLQLDQIRLIAQTQAVSSAKSTFISHMSHELRTPLHTILSSTQYLIGYEGLSLPQQEKVATIESSADHLLGMINDILDLVQIEAGKVTVEIDNVHSEALSEMTQEVCTMLSLLAEQKELELSFENRLSEPLDVSIDRRYFKQILINLLSNAVKFTSAGYISVSLQMCEGSVCLCVKDSGHGLSKEDIAVLFEEFTQASSYKETKQKGSGLGLAISSKLAALFDAELTLKSEGLGKGTEAVLKLKIMT